MRDVVGCEKGRDQVSDGSCFSTVRTELEGAQTSLPAEDTILLFWGIYRYQSYYELKPGYFHHLWITFKAVSCT